MPVLAGAFMTVSDHLFNGRSMSRVKTAAVLVVFLVNTLLPAGGALAQGGIAALNLPVPGTMVRTSPVYLPPLACGMAINRDDPLKFSFIIDKGDSGLSFESDAFRQESSKLVKYFLAALTVPEKEQWVNLSPYEKDRIVGDGLGQTEMGRDMLAQDYILKQLTASLVYPEDELGKEFWQKVYQQAKYRFGVTDVPLDTFNKVWIIPDKGVVYEKGNKVFVIEQHLKVMLEQDYLALQKTRKKGGAQAGDKAVSAVMSDVVRAVIIPAIEKEVNTGRNFASLRQIYNSMILAVWYKKTLRESLLGRIYVDRDRTAGIRVDDPKFRQQIYEQYVASFKAGVYNYIKEEADPVTGDTVPKKYVSGGATGFSEKNLRAATREEARPWIAARKPDGAAEVSVDLAEAAEKKARASVLSALAARFMPGAKPLTNAQVLGAVEAQAPGAGVLMPTAALRPSTYLYGRDTGIGDFGPASEEHILMLEKAGVRDWLDLPPHMTDENGCPYNGSSLFALNENSLSPEALLRDKLISEDDYKAIVPENIAASRVPFSALHYKEMLARKGYGNYLAALGRGQDANAMALRDKFEKFKSDHTAREVVIGGRKLRMDWLQQFAQFRAISAVQGESDWTHWPAGLRDREPDAVASFEAAHRDEIEFIKFFQFLLRQQWDRRKQFAKEHHVRILSDMPIYPRFNSADMWGNQAAYIYEKDTGKLPVHSGVPGDAFAPDGQDWGHPVYNWMREDGIDFLLKRFIYSLELAEGDPLRSDHFIGLADPWVVPEGIRASDGHRLRDEQATIDPRVLFDALREQYPNLPDLLFVEDLGAVTPLTVKLLNDTGLKGMKLTQFMSVNPEGVGPKEDIFNPRNYFTDTVAFNGTHDNETTRAWYRSLNEGQRNRLGVVLADAGITEAVSEEKIAFLMDQLLFTTNSDTAVLHYADVLAGDDGVVGLMDRYNIPGTEDPNNWSWRMLQGAFNDEVIDRLKKLVVDSRRSADNWIERREPVRMASPVAQLALRVLGQGNAREKQLAAVLAATLHNGRVRKADLRQGILTAVYQHTDGRPYIILSRSAAARDGGFLTLPQQAKSLIDALEKMVPQEVVGTSSHPAEDIFSRLESAFDGMKVDYTRVVQDEGMREKIVTFLGALVNANMLDNELDADTRDRLRKTGLADFRVYYSERYRDLWGQVFTTYENQGMPRQDIIAGLLNGSLPLINQGQLADLVATVAEAFGDEISAATGTRPARQLVIPLHIQDDIARINREGKFEITASFAARDGVLAAHYKIADKQAGTELEVSPEDGFRVFHFTGSDGVDVNAAPMHYGFPIGEVSKTFVADGKEYRLEGQPGLSTWEGHYYHPGAELGWSIQGISSDDHGVTVKAGVEVKDSPIIPGHLAATMAVTLKGNRLTVWESTLNKGDSPVPDLFGIHPWWQAAQVRILMSLKKHVNFPTGALEDIIAGRNIGDGQKITTGEAGAFNDTFQAVPDKDGLWRAWVTMEDRQIVVEADARKFPLATGWTEMAGAGALEPTATVRDPFSLGTDKLSQLQELIPAGAAREGPASFTIVTREDVVRLSREGVAPDKIAEQTGASLEFVKGSLERLTAISSSARVGADKKTSVQLIKAGMAFIFGTGNNGAVVGEDGNIETDGGALLELGHNIVFRASTDQWVFTGKEMLGRKPVLEPGDHTFESIFNGVGIARQLWDDSSFRSKLFQNMDTDLQEDEITAYLNILSSDTNEENKRQRALVVDMVLRAGSGLVDKKEDAVEDFVDRLGGKIGSALAAMFVVYQDAPWVKNFVMVSGVGENFARARDPEKDILLHGIRHGVREALIRAGVAGSRVEEIVNGVHRSRISWEREIIAARLTADEMTRIKDREAAGDKPYIAVGVSIGGTKIGAGQISLDGRIMTDEPVEVKWREAYPESSDGVTRGIVDQVKRSLAGADVTLLRKIGIAFAGPVDRERGIVGTPFKAPNLPFENYSLAVKVKSEMEAWIKEQTGVAVGLVVDVYNDAHAAVLGEARSPAGLLQGDSSQEIEKTGGINLDAALMGLQILRDGHGVPLPLSRQPLEGIRISGLEPQIRKIVPVSIPALLEQGAITQP